MSANSSKMTIDHDEIRQWAESRGGRPATVKSTEKKGEPGILRIDFPGYSGEGSLEEISWDDFFAKFEESNLAFVYQEKTADGQTSNFSKLVSRPEDMVQKGKSTSGAAKGGSKAKSSGAKGGSGGGELDVEIEVQMDLDKEPGGAEQRSHAKQARGKGGGQAGEGAQEIEVEAQIDLDEGEGERGGAEQRPRGKQPRGKGAEDDHSSHMTVDHDEIRAWVEARGGRPATVTRTEKNGEPGVLRIDFPGFSGEDTLEEISWDDFFAKFEESNLAFVYQEAKANGEPSYFSKLVSRPDDMGGKQAKQGKSKSKKAA
ncbi:hypothetical protein WME98_35955 [Sorangium sp. So ce296]|uniref:hypothetical protein n=1 Tax=Sorangium sp. So ce296 TaxID=3133296 RepID=UPI003F5F2D90